MRSNALKADALLLLVTFLAAISWIFSKEAIALMPPLLFLGLRFVLAGAVLALWGWPEIIRLNRAQWLRALRVGLVFAFGMSCWIQGLAAGVHLGEGGFLTSLGVVLVPVLAWLVFDEKVAKTTWVALPLASLGLALLFIQHPVEASRGQLWFVVAACLFALFYILNTRASNDIMHKSRPDELARQRVPALALTTLVMTTVGLTCLLFSAGLERWQPTWQSWSMELTGWLLASAIIGSAARFLVQTYAQSLSVHNNGVVILVIEPVWIAMLAAVWFGERMSGMQWLGCSLILAALLVSRAGPVGHRLWQAVLRPDSPA